VARANKSGNELIVEQRFNKLVGDAVIVAANNSSPVRAATQPAAGVFISGMP